MDVNSIFKEAFLLTRQRFWRFFLIGLPFMAFSFWYLPYSEHPTFDSYAPDGIDPLTFNLVLQLLAALVNLILSVLAAVKCHAIFLRHERVEIKDYLVLSYRHLKFLWVTIKLVLIFVLLYFPAQWLWWEASWKWEFGDEFADTFHYLLIVSISALWARLSLVLPATALGDKLSMRESWRLTGKNKFAIFALVAALPTVTNYSLDYLYLFEYEFIGYVNVVCWGLVSLFELGLLSMCYRYYCETYIKTESHEPVTFS